MRVKLGIFLCDCEEGLKNIDFAKLGKSLEGLDDVAFVDIAHDLCTNEGEKAIASRILTEDINRIVIAGCSPSFYEKHFTELLKKLRMESNILAMANIKEQCSWATKGDATNAALEAVMMAISRARLLQPVETTEVPVNQEAMVIGGGFSGMSTALELARMGIKTTLVEKENDLGGKIRQMETMGGQETDALVNAVKKDKNIDVLTSTELLDVKGNAGRFTAEVKKDGEKSLRKCGAMVLATGYRPEVSASDFPVCGTKVTTQMGLAKMLEGEVPGENPHTIAFMFDVSDENSRLSTLATLNNAMDIRQRWGSEVYVFCKSVKVDSEGIEKLYRDARGNGVIFIKYDESPKVVSVNGQVKIEATDPLLGDDISLSCDLLVAEESILPAKDAEALSAMTKVGTDSKGFYQEENVHLYPVLSERKGILFAGSCRGDLDITRLMTDITSVAAKVYALLSQEEVSVEADRVKVDPQKCVVCLTCVRVCPHKAIEVNGANGDSMAAEIQPLACDQCGICAAICPVKAITFEGYSDEQIMAQIEAIGAS